MRLKIRGAALTDPRILAVASNSNAKQLRMAQRTLIKLLQACKDAQQVVLKDLPSISSGMLTYRKIIDITYMLLSSPQQNTIYLSRNSRDAPSTCKRLLKGVTICFVLHSAYSRFVNMETGFFNPSLKRIETWKILRWYSNLLSA